MSNTETQYYRRVIRVRGEDSPNVRRQLDRQRRGLPTSDEVVVPGVLSWREYQIRRATWDKVRQTVGLDALFYEGAEVLLFPPEWLDRAERLAREALGVTNRKAKGVGVDPAEGGDDTSLIAVDDLGWLDGMSLKTPDTNAIYAATVDFVTRTGCLWERVVIDRGGGGKQLADRLRASGKRVQTVSFGEAPSLDLKRHRTMFEEKVEVKEERTTYKNLRAEMYGVLREWLNPAYERRFGIPSSQEELRRQLAPLPLLYDGEDKMYLPPKNKPTPSYQGVTIRDLIGRSPDDADALVMALRGMTNKAPRPTAGALVA